MQTFIDSKKIAQEKRIDMQYETEQNKLKPTNEDDASQEASPQFVGSAPSTEVIREMDLQGA